MESFGKSSKVTMTRVVVPSTLSDSVWWKMESKLITPENTILTAGGEKQGRKISCNDKSELTSLYAPHVISRQSRLSVQSSISLEEGPLSVRVMLVMAWQVASVATKKEQERVTGLKST